MPRSRAIARSDRPGRAVIHQLAAAELDDLSPRSAPATPGACPLASLTQPRSLLLLFGERCDSVIHHREHCSLVIESGREDAPCPRATTEPNRAARAAQHASSGGWPSWGSASPVPGRCASAAARAARAARVVINLLTVDGVGLPGLAARQHPVGAQCPGRRRRRDGTALAPPAHADQRGGRRRPNPSCCSRYLDRWYWQVKGYVARADAGIR